MGNTNGTTRTGRRRKNNSQSTLSAPKPPPLNIPKHGSFESRVEQTILQRAETPTPSHIARRSLVQTESEVLPSNESIIKKSSSSQDEYSYHNPNGTPHSSLQQQQQQKRPSTMHPPLSQFHSGSGTIVSTLSSSDHSLGGGATVSSGGGGSGQFPSDRSLRVASWSLVERMRLTKRAAASDVSDVPPVGIEEDAPLDLQDDYYNINNHSNPGSGRSAYFLGEIGQNEKEKNRPRFSKSKARQMFLDAMIKSALMSKTPETLRRTLFDECVVPIFVKKAEVLFEAGTTGRVLFVLVSGVLERIHPDGTTKFSKSERFIKAPHVVGEQCLLLNDEHAYTCVVKEPGLVLCVHRLQYQMVSAQIAKSSLINPDKEHQDFLYSSLRTSAHSVASVPLLEGLSEDQVKKLDEALIEKTFKHYSTVIHAADRCPGLYIIKSGRVSLRAHGSENTSSTAHLDLYGKNKKKPATKPAKPVEWLGPGDFFGELSLLNGSGQLGLDVVCAMDVSDSWHAAHTSKTSVRFPTVTLSLLPREDFVRILGGPEMLVGIEATHLMRCISNLPYFSYVSTREVTKLAEYLMLQKHLLKYEKGTNIVAGGAEIQDDQRGMFVIIDGPIRMLKSPGMAAAAAGVSLHRLFEKQESSNIATASLSASDLLLSERGIIKQQGSFMSLAPELVGGSTAKLETDHDALFPESIDELTILFSGVFGEDVMGFEQDFPKVKEWPSYAVALGSVTVAHITEHVLRTVGIYELVQRAYLDEIKGVESDDPFREITPSPPSSTREFSQSEDKNLLLPHPPPLRRLSSEFLNAGDRIPESEREQALTRMMTSKFDLTSGKFCRLAGLHQTPLVDVYVAMHLLSNQLVILKSIDVEAANLKGMAQYLLSEQLVLSQLSTPFVANLFASWEEPGKFVLSIEPCLGGDYEALLFNTLANKNNAPTELVGDLGGLSFDFVRFTSACIVLALKHCYEHRIIHRDLKPGNITLDHHGYAKLVDFGIAKVFTSSVFRTKSYVGSPKYMSPEMNALGFGHTTVPYTNSVDWWAFGVTLYQLALGFTPFEGVLPNWHQNTSMSSSSNVSSSHEDKIKMTYERIELYSRQTMTRDELHPIFTTFPETDANWSSFRDFLRKLLEPNPHKRLGSSNGGPREAMDSSLFNFLNEKEWDSLYRRQLKPPYRPNQLIVDMKKIREKAKEIKERGVDAVTMDQKKPRPKLVHSQYSMKSLESKVRDAVESPSQAHDTRIRNNVEQSQLLEDFGREMQLRSLVLKQSLRGDGAFGAKKNMQMSVLMRAGVLRSLQTQMMNESFFERQKRNFSYLELISALRIQRQWRGVRARRSLRVEKYVKYMEAVLLIQRFLRAWLTKRREQELVAMALM